MLEWKTSPIRMAGILLSIGRSEETRSSRFGVSMQLIESLLEDNVAPSSTTPIGRLHDAARALLYALLAAAVWGVCAGAGHIGQALANVYRVPVVILVSAVATLPAAVLLWKAFSVRASLADLLVAYARATLHGSVALAAFAPLLAIYSFTSSSGIVSALALGSAIVALLVAGMSFVKNLLGSVERSSSWRVVPVALVTIAIQLAALPQLISVMSPILPSPTALVGGVEGLFGGGNR